MADVALRVFGSETPTFRAGPGGSNLKQLHATPAHTTDVTTEVSHAVLATGTWLLSPLTQVSATTAVPTAPSTAANRGWRDNAYLHPDQGTKHTRITGSWVFTYSLHERVGVLNLSVDFTVICYAINASNVSRELWRDTSGAILVTPIEANFTQTVSPGAVLLNPGEILQFEFYQTVLTNPNLNSITVFRVEAATGALTAASVDVPEILLDETIALDGGGSIVETGVVGIIGPTDTASGGGALTAAGVLGVKDSSGNMDGGGAVAAAGVLGLIAIDNLTGGGSLLVQGALVESDASALAGGGALTAAGVVGLLVPDVLDGGGAIIESGVVGLVATETASGGGSLYAQGFITAANAIGTAGGGSLEAAGNLLAVGTVDAGGGGSLIAQGSLVATDAAEFAGGGALTAVGAVATNSDVTPSGGGALEIAGQISQPLAAEADGGGSVEVVGRSSLGGTPFEFAGGGSIEAVGALNVMTPQESLTGGGSLYAQGFLTIMSPVASFSGGGGITVSAAPIGIGCDPTSARRLAPDAIIGINNLAGGVSDVDGNPDTDAYDFLTAPLPLLPTYVEVSFPTPLDNPDGAQQIRVRVRPTFLLPDVIAVTEGLLPPEVLVEVADVGGAVIASTQVAVPGTYPDGGLVTLEWDAGALIDPTGASVQVRVRGVPFVLGMVGWTTEVGGIAWLVNGGCSQARLGGGGGLIVEGVIGLGCHDTGIYEDIYIDVYEPGAACPPLVWSGGGTLIAAGFLSVAQPVAADGGGSIVVEGHLGLLGDAAFGGGGTVKVVKSFCDVAWATTLTAEACFDACISAEGIFDTAWSTAACFEVLVGCTTDTDCLIVGNHAVLTATLFADGNPVSGGDVRLITLAPGADASVDQPFQTVGAGMYRYELALDTPGVWRYRWEAGEPAAVDEECFTVKDRAVPVPV